MQVCIVGCQSAKPKSGELWLIDSSDASLYRVLKNEEEEFIPILENPDMHRFVCMDLKYVAEVCPSQTSKLENLLQAVPVGKLLGK